MTSKLLKLFGLTMIVFVSCSKEVSEEIPTAISEKPLEASRINATIDNSFRAKNEFDWSQADDNMLWSAIEKGNNIATIGFGNFKDDFDRSKLQNNKDIENELLEIIQHFEKKPLDKILITSDKYLNLIDVVIENKETVEAIRKSKYIRYFEPSDYRYFENSNQQRVSNPNSTDPNSGNTENSSGSSGCGFESETLSTSDYTTVTPNAKAPWTFYKHNIPSAWSYSSGSGITIGIIDTGVSPNQTLLGSSFNTGSSTGRTIQKYGTYVDSIWPWSSSTDGPNDQCGHGTSMSSVAAAPRNNIGMPVGVAYNANLIVYRAASNVVLEGYHEQNGVKNAFVGLANNSNVKIISMSMGHIISVGKISDGVQYAYSKGKLIFCAGGTSTSFTNFVGVIFPASMNETVAVTGVIENTSNSKCDVCHSGSKIDFTIQMQRASSGNTVPVNSYYNSQTDYVGGSSVATATTAGIAALVWSKNPSWTRDQVLTKMKQSSTYYPTKNSDYGYGNINALLAVQ